jgi:anthranilate/para-aminobenzoate synthase component II
VLVNSTTISSSRVRMPQQLQGLQACLKAARQTQGMAAAATMACLGRQAVVPAAGKQVASPQSLRHCSTQHRQLWQLLRLSTAQWKPL